LAAAVAVTAAGGWVAHRTYTDAGLVAVAKVEPEREQAEETRKRLAAAEDAFKDAEAKLAEQQATEGEVRRALQLALSDLAVERKRKDEAVAAIGSTKGAVADLERAKLGAVTELAAARESVAREKALAKAAAERATALQAQIATLQADRDAEREELRKARAAMQGAQAALEALRAAKPAVSAEPAAPPPEAAPPQQPPQQDAEKVPAALPAKQAEPPQAVAAEPAAGNVAAPEPSAGKTAPPPPKGACAVAVQGRWKTPGPWAARLCQGAETSPEPVRCYEELMRGKVSWGSGSAWTAPHALTLCSGSRNARQTIDCFSEKIAAAEPWQTAIQGCRSN
jgi:hypothetical protein